MNGILIKKSSNKNHYNCLTIYYLEEFYHIKYLIYFIFSLNGIYLIGHLFYNLFETHDDSISKQLFFKMILGCVIIIIPTSLIFTSFNTVQLAFLIPFIFFIKNIKVSNHISFKVNFNELVLLNICSFFIILFQFQFYSKIGTLNLLPVDMNNHAQLSFFMANGGFESKFAEVNSLGFSCAPTRTPYHYTDIWLNVFLSKILPSTKIGYTMIYITYPILYTTYLSGLYMLGRRYITKKVILFLICILGIFVGPLDLIYLRELFFDGHLFSNNTIIFENIGFFFNTLIFSYHGQKHIPFYLLSILIIYFLIKKDLKKALIFISIAPIINIGLLPAVFGAVVLYSLFLFFTFKNFKQTLLLALPTILTIIFVLLYYRINGSYDSEKQTDILFLNPDLNTKGIILKMFFRIVYTSLFILLLYFPILFFLKKIKGISKSNDLIIFSFLLIMSSLSTRLILEGFNTLQFVTFTLPFFNVLLIVVFQKKYNKHKVIVVILMLIFFVINLKSTNFHTQTRRNFDAYKVYSKTFVSKVCEKLKKLENPSVGYLLGNNIFKSIQPGFWFGYYPCEFLFVNDYFKLYSINYPNYSYEINSSKTNDFSPNHLRYFMSKNISESQYEKLLVPFIQLKKIHFIVCSKDTKVPSVLHDNICDSLIDNKSGDKFYRICIY